MLDLLKILLAEQEEQEHASDSSIERNFTFPNLPHKITVVMGMRRVGKTYCLLQEMQRLKDHEGITRTQCLYLNFEDDRLLPCTQQKLCQLLDSFYQLYPENHTQIGYLFLDEIQNVTDWSRLMRRFMDTKKVKIYLSGSSAKLLSTEIATELRGRSISMEVWPYSFQEYLHAHHISLSGTLFGQKNQDILFQQLRNYLHQGGFPETTTIPTHYARQILQDYVELVIMRDIVERHHIKNIAILKYLIQTLLKNTACCFSIHKFFQDLKSQGLPSAKNVLYDYLAYLEDSYLVFPVSLFSESLRQSQSNPRKIYAIDSGLVKAYTLSLNENYGHLFENLVFLDLKRSGHKIYYYLTQEKYEVDFLVEDLLGNRMLYQVVWDCSNPKTLDREQRALTAAKNELKIEGKLITPLTYIENAWNEFKVSKKSSSKPGSS
jgi:hypothetical protein